MLGCAHSLFGSALLWFDLEIHNTMAEDCTSLNLPFGRGERTPTVAATVFWQFYTWCQQLQIASQEVLPAHLTHVKTPAPLFSVSKPTRPAVRCTWLGISYHCFISRHDFVLPPREQRLGTLVLPWGFLLPSTARSTDPICQLSLWHLPWFNLLPVCQMSFNRPNTSSCVKTFLVKCIFSIIIMLLHLILWD